MVRENGRLQGDAPIRASRIANSANRYFESVSDLPRKRGKHPGKKITINIQAVEIAGHFGVLAKIRTIWTLLEPPDGNSPNQLGIAIDASLGALKTLMLHKLLSQIAEGKP